MAQQTPADGEAPRAGAEPARALAADLHDPQKPRGSRFWRIATAVGPGLIVCLADTDGPCMLTAGQSGAQWGYSLLGLQILMAPILFVALELTVRLGLARGVGLVAMLREDIGPRVGWLVAVPLLASCFLGLMSEYSVVSQTMALWGWPVFVTDTLFTVLHLVLAYSGSYAFAEKVGIAMGACQALVFATAIMARPKGQAVLEGLASFPLYNSGFVKLVTANIGAIIMPWMLAYQQSAISNKFCSNKGPEGSADEHLLIARADTAVGSIITQGVMAAMLVTVAAAVDSNQPVGNMVDVLDIFTPVLGSPQSAKVLLTFAFVGACMAAAVVQTHCAAWVFEEVVGRGQSAAHSPGGLEGFRQRLPFFGSYTLVCIGGFIFTMIFSQSVVVGVMTEFINGLLMPPVVFALWYLAAFKLPEEQRLGRCYRWLLFSVFFVCSAFCLVSVFFSFQDEGK